MATKARLSLPPLVIEKDGQWLVQVAQWEIVGQTLLSLKAHLNAEALGDGADEQGSDQARDCEEDGSDGESETEEEDEEDVGF